MSPSWNKSKVLFQELQMALPFIVQTRIYRADRNLSCRKKFIVQTEIYCVDLMFIVQSKIYRADQKFIISKLGSC